MTTLSERDSLIQIYSDFHKDAYGFRPRGVNYHEFTLEELQADFARFERVCDEEAKWFEELGKWEAEQEAERKRLRKAEQERIASLKTLGGQFPELAALLAA